MKNVRTSNPATRTSRSARRARSLVSFAAALSLFAGATLGWDAAGHRAITLLALDGLSPEAPAFLREESTRKMIASQACEPDRWRAVSTPALTHVSNPDHYIDAEDLPNAGLALATLPELRYDYVAAIVRSRAAEHAAAAPPEDAKDAAHVHLTPGTLPYAIVEDYAKLQAAFKTLRILEKLNDPARAFQVDQCRANVVCAMGVLSHFVGDAAQPLHTTRHHHGWVGENPNDYTRRYSFHAEIDGGVLEFHALRYDTLKPAAHFDAALDAKDPMPGVKTYIDRSFHRVEPLYALDKSGGLLKDEGKTFVTERLTDASAVLAALYNAAWQSAAPTDEDVRNFVKFDKFDADAAHP